MSLHVSAPMPSLLGVTNWLNREPSLEELRGHCVLVYFWAASCPSCLYNMAAIHKWKAAYRERGLCLIAVHLPRAPADRDPKVVAEAVKDHGIDDPCALDNDGALAERFQTGGIWPYYFFFDAAGRLRNRAAGGMGLRLLENSLKRFLEEREASPPR